MTRIVATAVTAVTAASMLTACSGGPEGGGGSGSPSSSSPSAASSPAAASSTDAADSASDLDQAAADAGVDPADPPKPIASSPLPGKTMQNEPVDLTLDLYSLERQDDLLILTMGITPDKSATSKPRTFYGWTGRKWLPQLVDTKNLKVHDIVRADADQVVTSTGAATALFAPGQTLYLYAVFAAPPQDVTTMTLKPTDGAAAMTGVKIQ
ncbi:hypothetical protein [Janibacter sp. Soil728]|uniref:hypothetical protein n=1 Tax=Janibacter sp. Soil728 TaxID=1736393 RepID=UPI0012E6F7CE|nr:hypothetical protein [Janibacter sp. Soil728]